MASLSLMHGLLIANLGLFMVLAGLLWSVRRQQVRESRRLDTAVQAIQQAQAALTKSTVGMGRRIKQLDGRVQDAERRVVLPATDEATFMQASRLVGLGATASDLVESCGVPRGEAELIVSLRRQGPAAATH